MWSRTTSKRSAEDGAVHPAGGDAGEPEGVFRTVRGASGPLDHRYETPTMSSSFQVLSKDRLVGTIEFPASEARRRIRGAPPLQGRCWASVGVTTSRKKSEMSVGTARQAVWPAACHPTRAMHRHRAGATGKSHRRTRGRVTAFPPSEAGACRTTPGFAGCCRRRARFPAGRDLRADSVP